MTLPTVHNTTNPQARGFDAQLDNLLLRLSVAADRQVKITSAESQAQRIQTSEVPEEFVSEFGDVYARSDFTGGSGLDLAHRRDNPDNAASRYWDSYGIKVVDPEPGQRRELCLLEDTAGILSLSSNPIRLLHTDGVLYATDGVNVRRTTNPTAATPTWSSANPTSGVSAAVSLASLGSTVYAAFGVSGLYKRASGSWSNVYADDADGVWSVKGRLVVSDGVDLWEEAGTARPAGGNELKVLAAGDTWVDVVDGGTAILAAATDGYVYAFAPGDTGTLSLVGQTRFETETPTCLGVAQGAVFVGTISGTTGRLWRAEISDGALVGAQVLREWESGAPREIVSDRENVYTVVAESAVESHTWRYNLLTGGVHRWWIFDGLAAGPVDCHGLALIGGRLFAGFDGNGVRRTTTTYPAAGGWLITPLGDFFTSEEKAWVAAQVETGTVAAGQTVELYYTGDPEAINDNTSSAWVKVAETASSQGGVLSEPIVNRFSRYAALQVRITPSTDGSACPAVRSVGVRAYPEEPDIVVELPTNVSDVVEAPGRRRARVRGRGSELYRELQAREGRPCLLRLYRPGETIRGVLQRVATPQSALTRRGSQTLFSLLTVRGRRTDVLVVPFEQGTTGTCLTGMCLTGGGG